MISRRTLLTAGGAAALSRPAQAQSPGRDPRIGCLMGRSEADPEGRAYIDALRDGLRQRGWDLGRINFTIRWLTDDQVQLRANVKDVIATRPDVLVVLSSGYLREVRDAAGSIPVVFVAIADPVGQGFVTNLARPGGTITGFGIEDASLGGKWVEYLKLIAPRIRSCTGIYNPRYAPGGRTFAPSMKTVGTALGVEATLEVVENETSLFDLIGKSNLSLEAGLVFLPDAWNFSMRQRVVAGVARAGTPAIYYHTAYARDGGLIALGNDRVGLFRRAADYVDRILKGADPGSLPVQMPDRFELAINVRTARAQGLTVPSTLAALADEVIE